MAIIKNATKAMETTLSTNQITRARKKADQNLFKIRLGDLRKQMKIRQSDILTFSQSAISKLEGRRDMKISTLVEYLENIGLRLEIKVFPKKKKKSIPAEFTLLKT